MISNTLETLIIAGTSDSITNSGYRHFFSSVDLLKSGEAIFDILYFLGFNCITYCQRINVNKVIIQGILINK